MREQGGWQARRGAALLGAVAVHAGLALMFTWKTPTPLPDVVSVPVNVITEAPPDIESEPEPTPVPELEPASVRPETPLADTIAPSAQDAPPVISPAPPVLAQAPSETPIPGEPSVPESQGRWTVQGWTPGATVPPIADIDTLQCEVGDRACQKERNFVFHEETLTPTERVWQPNRAWQGLGPEFIGMDSNEVQLALGGKVAGGNAQVIIPGMLVIDGPIWDAMHGVNKTCGLQAGQTGEAVGLFDSGASGPRRIVMRDCPAPRSGEAYDRERFMGTRDDVDWIRRDYRDPDAVAPIVVPD